MATILLGANEDYTASAGKHSIYADAASQQTITVSAGASVTFLAGSIGDNIVLAGDAANYTAVLNGNQVTLTDLTTGATIVVPADTTGTSVVFDDGALELVIDTTGETEAITLGGTEVTGTEAPVTGEPTDPEEPTEAPSEEPTDPSVPGESFTLTAGRDVLTGTAGDDTFEASTSGLSSGRTLNAEDSIDGGEGNDTLKVDLQGNFSGFSKDGGVTNVETIALTNEGSVKRTFDATGVEGDVNYVVNAGDATVNLIDVGSAAGSVTLTNQADGSFSIGYATDATKGTSDNLALNLNAVGTVDDASTSADEEKAVAITAAGVESATVSVTGDNVVDLNAVAATSYTVEGEGSLKVTKAAANLTSFDASALTGDLDLVVDAGTARKNATIAGGESTDDTVRLTGAGTVQYVMSGVENVVLEGGALTFSASNASGIETISATGSMTGAATFAGLGNADLALNVEKGAKAVSLDNSGTTTVNIADADGTATSPVTVASDVTLTKSTAAIVNVAENVLYSGTVAAGQAESVTVAAAGGFAASADIQAGNASEIVINQVDEDSVLNLTAGDAEQLTVTADADLNLAGSTLTSLQVLNVDTDGAFSISKLDAINSVNLEGLGSVVLGALGTAAQDGYGITVNAGTLSNNSGAALNIASITTGGTNITVNAAEVLGGVTLGAIKAGAGNVTLDLSNVGGDIILGTIDGKAVTVDASDALGTVTNGTNAITGTSSVNYSGTELDKNEATIAGSGTSFTGVINGGIATDKYTVNLTHAGLTKFNLSGDLGTQDTGKDDVLIVNLADVSTTSKEVAATYNVAGVEDLTFKFADANDTVKLSANSSLAGVTNLTVTNGTLDVSALANAADFAGIANVTINSGLSMTAAQLKAATKMSVVSTSTGDLQIKVSTKEEAEEVANLIINKAGTSGITAAISYAATASKGVMDAVTIAITTISNNGLKAKTIEEADDGSTIESNTTEAKTWTVSEYENVAEDLKPTTYVLEDTVANLAGAAAGVLDGATTYSIKDTSAEILGADAAVLNGATNITATIEDSAGNEDVSGLKGKGVTVDLSSRTIEAGEDDKGFTLKLAEFNAETNNKSDLEGPRKSDFTVKLPALAEIKGELKIVNMTISNTEDKPNDVVKFAEADSKATLLEAIESITVTNGTGETEAYSTLTIKLVGEDAGSIVLENVIKSTAVAVEAVEAVEAVTWTQMAGNVDGISVAGVISNTKVEDADLDGNAVITSLVEGLVSGSTFDFFA